MPAIPDLDRPLGSGRVHLRLAAERDIPEVLIAHQDDPCLHGALGLTRPPSGAELGRQLEQAPVERTAGLNLTFTVLEAGSDDCRGQLLASQFDWDNARAELLIWVTPQARGRGLAAAALGLGASWLFENCSLARVQLLAEPDNEPLLRAAAAAGFRAEGTLRGHQLQRGVRADRIVLSLLPADAFPTP